MARARERKRMKAMNASIEAFLDKELCPLSELAMNREALRPNSLQAEGKLLTNRTFLEAMHTDRNTRPIC